MNQPTIREFRLGGPNGDGRRAYVNRNGAFLGPGVALLAKDALGRWRPRPQARLEALLGIGYGIAVDLDWRMTQLASVGRALDKGDLALAAIALVQGEFPPLPNETRAARMAKADGIARAGLAKFNPNHDPDTGEFASGPGGASAPKKPWEGHRDQKLRQKIAEFESSAGKPNDGYS